MSVGSPKPFATRARLASAAPCRCRGAVPEPPQTPGSPEDTGDPRAASLPGSGPPPACCLPSVVWACPKRAAVLHGDQGKVCQITGWLAGAQWLVLCCLGGNRALPKSSFLSGTSVNARLHGDESFQVQISGLAMNTGPSPSLPGSQQL